MLQNWLTQNKNSLVEVNFSNYDSFLQKRNKKLTKFRMKIASHFRTTWNLIITQNSHGRHLIFHLSCEDFCSDHNMNCMLLMSTISNTTLQTNTFFLNRVGFYLLDANRTLNSEYWIYYRWCLFSVHYVNLIWTKVAAFNELRAEDVIIRWIIMWTLLKSM